MRSGLIAVIAGFLVAYAASQALKLLLLATGAGGRIEMEALSAFAALLAGGYVAGRLGSGHQMMKGALVAVIFIFIGASLTALQELDLVAQSGPLALPRMNIRGLLSSDLLLLVGGAIGGWLAARLR